VASDGDVRRVDEVVVAGSETAAGAARPAVTPLEKNSVRPSTLKSTKMPPSE
jgi:hypothetical protein